VRGGGIGSLRVVLLVKKIWKAGEVAGLDLGFSGAGMDN
jgi:hypothetical protein